MPKYLFQASYIGEGVKGLLKEGGSKRKDTVENGIDWKISAAEGLFGSAGNSSFACSFPSPFPH